MSTQPTIDAHQCHSTGTGPETEEKPPSASRYNAVKHGLTAKTPVLPNEDEAAYLDKVAVLTESVKARNPHEQELALRAAQAAWSLDRANRAEVARMTLKMQTEAVEAEFQEAKKAALLGNRLFFDRRGPVDFYPSRNYIHGQPRTSWSEDADQDPAMLVLELETTLAGCRWLLAQWSSLKALLVESGGAYGSVEKFKFLRLRGREPTNAISVREVAQVFLACHAIEPQYEYAFQEIRCETEDDRFKHYKDQLSKRSLEAITPPDATAARAVLLSIADKAIERLRMVEAKRQALADNADRLRADIHSQDDSKSGYQLARLKVSCNRLIHQNLDAINKGRRAEASGWGRTSQEREQKKEERRTKKTGRLLMRDENGVTRYVDDYEREQALKARIADALGADGWADAERVKAARGLSQKIASKAGSGNGAEGVAPAEAVPVMLTEIGERAEIQNEPEGSRRIAGGGEVDRVIEEGAEETCGREDGGDPPGARDPRLTEAVPVMLTGTGERANLQNELDVSRRPAEGGEGGPAIAEGAQETYGRADFGVRDPRRTETCGRANGGDPPGARDPRRTETCGRGDGGDPPGARDPRRTETCGPADGGDPPGARDPGPTETRGPADGGDPPGARDPRPTEAVPVMLTETGERANLQNELERWRQMAEGGRRGEMVDRERWLELFDGSSVEMRNLLASAGFWQELLE